MNYKDAIGKALTVADALSAAEPQIAILVSAVRGGYMAIKAARQFFADQSGEHDKEKLDAIIAEFDKRVGRWETTTF